MQKIKLVFAFLFLVTVASAQNHCLNFDGIDDYVDLGNQIGNGNIRTIEMWFKPDVNIDANSNSDYTALIARNNIGENCEFAVYFSEGTGYDGQLAFVLAVTNGNYNIIYSDQNSWTAGTWYHVAATVDNVNGMKMYVNGVLQAQTNPYTNAPCAANDITTLGIWGDINIRHFNGSIDEVRLWNFARTQTEVQTDMNQEISSGAGLVAAYHFNQGIAGGTNTGLTTLNDAVGSNNGTLQNFGLTGTTSNWVACSNAALPVELLSFTGKNTEEGSLLTWQTASETQNKGFDIERSNDGSRFEKIGFVASNGTTLITQSYTFEDNTSKKGISYYRLKQLDVDGGFEYSKIVTITQNGKNDVSVFPNPSNGVFTIIGLEDVKDETYTLMNNVGKTLSMTVQNNNQLDMSAFPSGVYYLRVQSSGQVMKLVKD